MFFSFHDMFSGGCRKTEYSQVYIEADSEDQAEEIFEDRLNRNPNKVTCECCGNDFSITEYDSLEEATEFERKQRSVTLDDYLKRDDILVICKEKTMNNPETMHERFEAVSYAYLDFDNIPVADRLHPSDDLCGILKVASLMKDPQDFSFHAEHDELYLPNIEDLVDLTDKDILYLVRCGISYDTDNECLYCFC